MFDWCSLPAVPPNVRQVPTQWMVPVSCVQLGQSALTQGHTHQLLAVSRRLVSSLCCSDVTFHHNLNLQPDIL